MTQEKTNNSRLMLGVAGLVAVLATAATVWALAHRRGGGGAQPGQAAPDTPDGDSAHPDEAWRAQTMSGSSQ